MTAPARRGAPRPRPGVGRWLLYVVWVPLPARYREWVLFDTTCRTWVLRHIARVLLLAAPPTAALAIFLPGGAELRGLTAFIAAACACLFVTIYVNESTDYRLLQAGYSWGTGERARTQRAELDDFNARLARWHKAQQRAQQRRR